MYSGSGSMRESLQSGNTGVTEFSGMPGGQAVATGMCISACCVYKKSIIPIIIKITSVTT